MLTNCKSLTVAVFLSSLFFPRSMQISLTARAYGGKEKRKLVWMSYRGKSEHCSVVMALQSTSYLSSLHIQEKCVEE